MERNDERGMISAVGLCVLTAIVLLGMAAAQFMRGGGSMAAEYEREMQLRLAAESAVETAAAALEQSADVYGAPPDLGRTKEIVVEGVPTAEKIELYVFIETPPVAGAFLDVGAAAMDSGEPHIPDGEDWMRAKVVRGRMEKKGNRYVWRRWF